MNERNEKRIEMANDLKVLIHQLQDCHPAVRDAARLEIIELLREGL